MKSYKRGGRESVRRFEANHQPTSIYSWAVQVNQEVRFRLTCRWLSPKFEGTGATGFDGVSEAVAACPGTQVLVKPLGKFLPANNNLALAA